MLGRVVLRQAQAGLVVILAGRRCLEARSHPRPPGELVVLYLLAVLARLALLAWLAQTLKAEHSAALP